MQPEEIQPYLNLIQQLLECPDGEEGNILAAHENLWDTTLVEVLGAVAANARTENQEGVANFLENIAQQLASWLQPQENPSPDHLNLLQEVLQAVANKSPDIHQLLENNLPLLDTAFLNLLQAWGNQAREASTREKTYQLGSFLYRLAYTFHEFPRGNPLINLAIAVYGYEFCAATERQPGLEMGHF